MARTDPPIKLKRSVLRRVVSTKLDALQRGEYFVRNHLGPECYDPIVAEAKCHLDSLTDNNATNNATNNNNDHHTATPQDSTTTSTPSLSEDFDTFVQIIAASILIDASMRGENAGESDPRFIKKKKKLLTKTLRGVQFQEFTSQIWRYDCLKRGITSELPPEEESEEEQDNNTAVANNSSAESQSSDDMEEEDSDQDNTSVTSHTSADGFSTSASSKRHAHTGSSSGGSLSKKKHHKKERKKLKKERKHKRREERRRRKEEKRRRKEEKKKKRKREQQVDNNDDQEEEEELLERETPLAGREEDDDVDEHEEKMDEDIESIYEIEHATKEEFEAFREDILSKIPNKVKNRFRQGGFSRWGKDWLPALEIGPFDVEPGPVRSMWMEMFHNVSFSHVVIFLE